MQKRFLKHGGHGTRLYSIWRGMTTRCNIKNTDYYKHYGGKGVKVCDEWKDFPAFYEWATANGYRENLTIERKDVNGDYCPENCCWIPLSEQMKNTTRTVLITYNNITKNQKEWANDIGISPDTLKYRIKKYGIEKALTMPKGGGSC